MNKSLPILTLWVFIAVTLVANFGALVVQTGPAVEAAPNAAAYEAVLGKPLNDEDVADFIASNRCSGAGQFQTCNAAGLALWVGQDQKIETVYLYPNKIAGFGVYTGKLPLGLSARDTMAGVEDRLGQPKVQHAPQAGWEPGLPDESGTPDHIHTWAIYKRFGVTVIYDSTSAMDKGASIYAVLVSK